MGVEESTTETKPAEESVEQTETSPAVEGQTEPTEPEFNLTDEMLKFKVRDEEHLIDEWMRPSITSEDQLKAVKDLYTSKHGIELAKKERQELQEQHEKLTQGLGVLESHINAYNNSGNDSVKAVQAGKNILDALGLDKRMALQIALDELKYNNSTEVERNQIDQQRNQLVQTQELQNQQTLLQQQLAQQHKMQFDAAISVPDVASKIEQYDAKIGKSGAFREFAIRQGIAYEQQNIHKTPADVINESLNLLGLNQAGTQTPSNSPGTVVHKKTLPNLSGSGNSPVKKVVNNLEDLVKLREKLEAQGA